MVKQYSDLTRKILASSWKKLSNLKYLGITVKFLDYETIKLRTYIDITINLDYKRLILKGNATEEQCIEAWESIVKKNNEQNGSFEYQTYFNNVETVAELLAEYNIVKGMLFILRYEIDYTYIEELKEFGYKISTQPKLYEASLQAAERKSDNIITKIGIKKSEIMEMLEASGPDASFDNLMATLSASLEYEVNDDITLARFNEYRKIIKKKYERVKSGAENR